MRPLLSLSLIFFATVATAAESERILFPIWTDFNVPGVSGSKWVAQVTINNPTDRPVGVFPIVTEYGQSTGLLQPRTSWTMTFIANTFVGGTPGVGEMAYVSRADADSLVYNDTILSPVAVEMPVVRERDLRTTALTLAPVPLDPKFRLMLRLYDPFRTPNALFAIQFWAEWRVPNTNAGANSGTTAVLLGSKSLTLAYPSPDVQFPIEAGYAELPIARDMLSNVPQFARYFAVDVRALTPGVRFWAFITATDNQTQQVLTVTPH